jgi:hypothetical protein
MLCVARQHAAWQHAAWQQAAWQQAAWQRRHGPIRRDRMGCVRTHLVHIIHVGLAVHMRRVRPMDASLCAQRADPGKIPSDKLHGGSPLPLPTALKHCRCAAVGRPGMRSSPAAEEAAAAF